ncbi:head decoration protein [Bradyrhizobium sp. SZCCHNR2012]|uniref:head decoration protein n=1 Tax=Bradyrhizobium sp. SZCCHNR2012 TaxID=3057377 RepID=UPI0028EB7A3F|nr:head decoration protein [Bradyrhizobium sp. SZCCHNR2012]
MTALVLTETLHAGAYLVSEDVYFSRDQVTVALNQNIAAGQVVGATDVIALTTASAAADAPNTGNGVLTLDVSTPVLAAAQDGIYRLLCIAAVANAGTFEVFDPKGVSIGKYNVGAAAFANQIKFTIADGATDFVAGDAFSVTVGVESNADRQVKAWDPAAVDGSQNPVGILMYPTVTDGTATKLATMTARHSEVRLSDLTFGGSPSAAQKAACIEQLRRLGIICR